MGAMNLEMTGRILQTVVTNATVAPTVAMGRGDEYAESHIFWGVNLFVLVLFSILFCVCWRCQHSRLLRGQQVADLQLQLDARRRAAEEKKFVPPEKRKAQLKASFARNYVTMTVRESDLCDDFTESLAQLETVREVNSGATTQTKMVAVEERVETAPTLECQSGNSETLPENIDTGAIADIETGLPEEENESDESDVVAVDACETGYLMLRSTRLKRPRPVPNCCAVCICPYEVGEVVVWSSNRQCKHAFHLDCMMDWLTKSFDDTPCPCCRQDFTDLVAFRKEQKITWEPGNAFNPSIVVLRHNNA